MAPSAARPASRHILGSWVGGLARAGITGNYDDLVILNGLNDLVLAGGDRETAWIFEKDYHLTIHHFSFV
jgi:hypothetical protein